MYDEYVSKINKRAARRTAIEKWFKKHRVILSVAAVLVIAAVFLLLFFTGAYLGTLASGRFVYGDARLNSTKAFLTGVDYSVKEGPDGGSGDSVNVDPAEVNTLRELTIGDYSVEARTVNPFGMVRTQEAALRIEKRPITVNIVDFRTVYGEDVDPLKVVAWDNLAEGDRLAFADIDFVKTAGAGKAEILTVTIVNSQGEDVTFCYDITFEAGNVEVLPRPLTIATGSSRKVYDRLPVRAEEYEIAEGTLAEGDLLTVSFPEAGYAEVGRYDNAVDAVEIAGPSGSVTYCYDITVLPGELRIDPIEIKLSTPDVNKMYDGYGYETGEYSIASGKLLEGDRLKITGENIFIAGTYQNRIIAEVVDESTGNDVTGHYNISYEYGQLKIDPRPVTVRSVDGKTTVYDGNPKWYPGAEVVSGSVAETDEIDYVNFASQITAGTWRNTFQANFYNNGRSVNNCYDVTYETGSFTITKRPLTLELGYNWANLTTKSYEVGWTGIVEGSIADSDYIIPRGIGFEVPFDQFEKKASVDIRSFSDDSTRTGSYDIKYKVVFDKDQLQEYIDDSKGYEPGEHGVPGENGTPKTGDENGNDIGNGHGNGNGQGNGDSGDSNILGGGISFESFTPSDAVAGYVTSTRPGQIYLRVQSFTDYGGKSWVNSEKHILEPGLAPLTLTYFALRNAGYAENNVVKVTDLTSDGILAVPYFSGSIYMDGAYDDDAVYLDTGYELVYGQVTQFDISKLAKLPQVISSGKYFTKASELCTRLPENLLSTARMLLNEAGINAGSPTVIEDVQTYLASRCTYNMKFPAIPSDADPVIYFLTESRQGICNHFASAAVVLYRALGIPARFTTGFLATVAEAEKTSEYTFRQAHAWVEVLIDGVGWIPVEVTPPSSGQNDDSTDTDENGLARPVVSLRLGYNRLIYYMTDAEKEYDGKPLCSETAWLQTWDVLKEGHSIVARTPSITNVGKLTTGAEEFKVVDADGNDVTDEYEVIEAGKCTIEVTTRNIVLDPLEIYVGQTLTQNDLDNGGSGEWSIYTGDRLPDMATFRDSYGETVRLRDLETAEGDYATELDTSRTGSYTYTAAFDMGEDSPKSTFSPEVTVTRTVTVLPLEHIRMMPDPDDFDRITGKYSRNGIVYITAENGREYALIHIESASAVKEFDGTYLTCDDYLLTGGALKKGHSILFKASGAQLYAGESDNGMAMLQIVDGEGNDMTREYIICFTPGKLTVTPGRYDVGGLSVDIKVDETADLTSLVWAGKVSRIPVEYFNESDSVAVFTDKDMLTGVNPGTRSVAATLRAADLNGDGVNDYIDTASSVTVNVFETPGETRPAVFVGIMAALALEVGILVFVLIRRYYRKKKEPRVKD